MNDVVLRRGDVERDFVWQMQSLGTNLHLEAERGKALRVEERAEAPLLNKKFFPETEMVSTHLGKRRLFKNAMAPNTLKKLAKMAVDPAGWGWRAREEALG